MSKKKRRKSGPSFVQLYRSVKRSEAYHKLSLPARCALTELLDRYNGSNNGFIPLSLRTVADELRCSQATAQRALRELDDSKLAWPMKVGAWRGRRATEWRIAFYRCDASGDLPVTMWKPRSEVHHESAKGSPEKRKRASRFIQKAQEPKNPYSNRPLRFTTKALVESNHVGTGISTHPQQASVQARSNEAQRASDRDLWDEIGDIPDFLDRRPQRLTNPSSAACIGVVGLAIGGGVA
jgi:hypothetical protein